MADVGMRVRPQEGDAVEVQHPNGKDWESVRVSKVLSSGFLFRYPGETQEFFRTYVEDTWRWPADKRTGGALAEGK